MKLRAGIGVLVLACFVGACTSGRKASPAAARPTAPASHAPSPSMSPLRVGRVSPPVVRLFAGTRSVVGTPLRYCLRGQCVDGASQPPRLTVDEGSIVAFTLGRVPERAVAELSGEGGGKRTLAPATLMAVPGRLAPGAHRVTLALSWSDASGTWAFELVAKDAG